MKTGTDLQTLAGELKRQAESKHDYVADTRAMEMNHDAGHNRHIMLMDGMPDMFGINDLAHGQIAEHTKIPVGYYNRMRAEAPELLTDNVQEWFRKYPAKRMVRTLDGNVRALLSDAYRPLDNWDFATAILPAIAARDLEVMSCEITERRLYIKAVDTKLFRDVPVGYRMGDGSHKIFDTCAPAFIASNSEVGYGRLVLETGVYTRACTNLALWADGGMKRTHVGTRLKVTEQVENIDHLLSERTKQKTDEALWCQLRDVLGAAFDETLMTRRVEAMTAAGEARITGKVEKVMEVTAQRFGLSADEQESVLKHLIEGGQLSQYGLHSAITRAAQDVASYDRATELEYLGGRVIELPRTDWESLAEAA